MQMSLPCNRYKYLRLKLQLILQGLPLLSLKKCKDLPLHLNAGAAISRQSASAVDHSGRVEKSLYLCIGRCTEKKK